MFDGLDTLCSHPTVNSSIIYDSHDVTTRYFSQICGYVGIEYSSPTLSSVMSNLAPAFTFILAFFFRYNLILARQFRSFFRNQQIYLYKRFLSTIYKMYLFCLFIRMETLNFRSYTSQAKIVGTVVSISGALIATLYNGASVTLSSDSSSFYWIIGGILLASQNFLLSFVLVLQVPKLHNFLFKLSKC